MKATISEKVENIASLLQALPELCEPVEALLRNVSIILSPAIREILLATVRFNLGNHGCFYLKNNKVPSSAVRSITEHHGGAMLQQQLRAEWPQEAGVEQLMVQSDGSTVPVVTFDEVAQGVDRRKCKELN